MPNITQVQRWRERPRVDVCRAKEREREAKGLCFKGREKLHAPEWELRVRLVLRLV